MITNLKKHYQNLLDINGPTPAAVQYRDQESQYKRFEILRNIDTSMTSIIDVGCGLGDLGDFLYKRGYSGRYLGLDFLEDFIATANEKHKDKAKFKFNIFDIWQDLIPNDYDYVVLSGVFNNRIEKNKEFMLQAIEKMFVSCRKGVAFNAMSTYVDYQDENLYYSNPLEVFDYCKKNLTRRIVLKHDYLVKEGSMPFEYTIYLYKEEK